MEKITDWAALWRSLVEMSPNRKPDEPATGKARVDAWSGRAREFERMSRKKWEGPDPARELVASQVRPDDTVLDIGAGTGSWSLFLAKRARSVTALDPSPSMLEVMRENVAAEGAKNVDTLLGAWPNMDVPPHDISLCSHAMYTSPDFPLFVRRMIEVARRTCYMLLKATAAGGVMGTVCQQLWGQPHDSPNFVIGYNILMQMGIYANVLVDPRLRPWKSQSLDAALVDLKRRLRLEADPAQDRYLMDVLAEKLVLRDGEYVWPDGMRSALVYWDVT